MANTKKTCRVCGKEYEACHSANMPAGVFRWQEVACSPECGEVYMQCVLEAREKARVAQEPSFKKQERPAMTPIEKATPTPVSEPVVSDEPIENVDPDETAEKRSPWRQ